MPNRIIGKDNTIPNYRITFSNRNAGISRKKDIHAENSDDAFAKAFKMPDAKSGLFTDVQVEEIPEGPVVVGIKFYYYDTVLKVNFTDYLTIKANSEADAVSYYNEHFKGKRFWFNAGKTEEEGKCIRGDVAETYFAACPGYDADATL